MLQIEWILSRADPTMFSRYSTAKANIVGGIQRFGNCSFPGGNDHGPDHIERIVEYLGKLVGPEPINTETLSSLELYLTMLAVLYHDIGMVRGRQNHPEVAEQYLMSVEGDVFREDPNSFLFDAVEREIIAAAVLCHGGKKDIAQHFRPFGERVAIRNLFVRPKVVAALLRIADELGEDSRRAPVRSDAIRDLPEEALFYWKFSQHISGISPDYHSKIIHISAKFQAKDVGSVVQLGGRPRLFLAAFGEKLAKMNDERQRTNQFLPETLRYERIDITLTPLYGHSTWIDARTFTFTDNTSGYQFVNAFPEILTEQPNASLYTVLLLKGSRRYHDAKIELEYLSDVESNRPGYQLRISYNLACVESRIAHSENDESLQTEALNRAIGHLGDWANIGWNGGWESVKRRPEDEIHRMCIDDDLYSLFKHRANEVKSALPKALRASFKPPKNPSGQGGCVVVGTEVSTPSGPLDIGRLRNGMDVLSVLTDRRAESVCASVAQIQSIKVPICVNVNERLTATPGQLVYEIERGWTPCHKLRPGMSIMRSDGTYEVIATLFSLSGHFEVYCFCTEHPSHNFVANGFVCHNRKE